MAKFPYFKWFPADAETDADYTAMSDTERGLYHHALNISWINGGLPTDADELARVLGRPQKYLEKYWSRIGKKFSEVDGVLVNPRQELERDSAILRSKNATSAVRTRYDRRSDVLPRAYECVSDVGLVVNSKKETKPIPRASDFAAFWVRWCELTGRKQREGDACRAWLSVVECEQYGEVMLCLERYGASGEVARGAITNPDKWLFEQARDKWAGDWPRLKSAAEIRSEALSRAIGDD